MLEAFRIIGFALISFRYLYWIGSVFEQIETYSVRILFAQVAEGVLLFFIFVQLFNKVPFFPMRQNVAICLIGFLLLVVGVLFMFLGKKALGKEWIYAQAYKKQKGEKLVTTGLYKLSRHPIYVGFVTSYVGMEFLAGSLLWISMLFLFVPFWYQTEKEELFLIKKFGKKYLDYMQRTKRFIPFLW